MKTQVFVHAGFLGIKSALEAEGLINDPSQPGQLGFVVDASLCEFQPAAIEILKKVPKSHDSIGDVDVFQAGDKVIFAWMGGPLYLIRPNERNISGSRSYSPGLLTPTEFDTPQDFVDFVEDQLASL